MLKRQRFTNLFGFNKNLYGLLALDGIVNFFGLPATNIGDKFRHNFIWIKYIIP